MLSFQVPFFGFNADSPVAYKFICNAEYGIFYCPSQVVKRTSPRVVADTCNIE